MSMEVIAIIAASAGLAGLILIFRRDMRVEMQAQRAETQAG